ANWTLSIRQPIFDDMTANEQTSVSRVADREKLPLLLDKARQFAGEYIDSLEERPVFPGEKSLRAMHALVESLPENPSDPFLILDQLQEIGAPAVVTQTGGRYLFRERRNSSGRARRQVDGRCLGPEHCPLRHVADQFASRRSLRTLDRLVAWFPRRNRSRFCIRNNDCQFLRPVCRSQRIASSTRLGRCPQGPLRCAENSCRRQRRCARSGPQVDFDARTRI